MPTLDELLTAGLEHFKARRYPQAMVCFGAALKADPTMPQVWSMLGICLSETGKRAEALQCFDEAVKLHPENPILWSNRANVLNLLEKFEDALASAERALGLSEELPDAWNNKGVALQCLGTRDRRLGRVQEALRCFNRALGLAPQHAGVLANKARAVEQIRVIDQIASAPDPTTGQGWMERGDSLGGPEQLRCYAKAVEADARLAPAWLKKALFEARSGKPRDAKRSLGRFLDCAGPELAKEIGLAKGMLAAMRQEGVPDELSAGLTDEALMESSRLVQEAADFNEAKQHGKAANAAERALAANPGSASAYFQKGYALDALGHDAEGLAAYDEALRLCPDYATAWQNKAALLCELKRHEESLPCWDRVIALHPGEGRWLDQKAKALTALGRTDEAVELTMKALEDPAFADQYHEEGLKLGEMMGMPRLNLSKEEQEQALEALASRDMSLAPKEIQDSAARLERQMSQPKDDPAHQEAAAWSEKARRALAEKAKDSPKRAIHAADQALKLVSDYPPALYYKGCALWMLDRACEASVLLNRFKERAWAGMESSLDAADSALSGLRGAGVPATELDDAARDKIDRAYRLYASEPGVDSAQTHEDRIAVCNKVLDLHPGHPNAWFTKGRSLEELKRPDEATRCYLEAGRLLPDFANAWIFGGRLLLRAGRFEEGLKAAESGLPHAPRPEDRTALRMLRVTALLASGRNAEGMAEIDAVLADPKLDAKLRSELVSIRSGLKAGPEAAATSVRAGGQAVAAASSAAPSSVTPAANGEANGHRKGEVIGNKYEVCGLLGMGGFGVVYQVYARETRMVYALKTFREEYLSDAGTREMFKREAQLWLDLGAHPYLVRAHYVDELHGRLYIAMEFLPPSRESPNTVEGWLKRGPIPLERATRWAVQFCHGMEYAGRRGVACHRDIKPANLLVGADGDLRVSDFGLAAALSLAKIGNRLGIRGTGEVGLSCAAEGGAGTPPYMPPEQFSASGRCDARSDVYAFGVTLYQMLSGRLPLLPPRPKSPEEGRRFWDEMRRLAESEPPPKLASPLWPLIQRCLNKDPARRYQSFAELRESLEEMLLEWTGERIPEPEAGKLTFADWNNRGASLNDLERFEDAVHCFDRALELEPKSARVLANKALALRGLGRAEEALAAADRALSLGSAASSIRSDAADRAASFEAAEPAAWNHRGLALLDLGRSDEAATAFERAVAVKPDLIDAWLNLASLKQTRGQHEAALECCKRALGVDAKTPGAWTAKGVSLDLLGRADQAVECYRKAVELDPNQFMAWMNLGILRRRQGKPAEALASYQKACDANPGYAPLWFNVAVADEELGRPDAAARAYERFLSLSPGPELKAQVELARRRLAELGPPEPKKAAPPAQGAGDAEILYNQAIDLVKQGDAKGALERLNLCVQADPRFEKGWLSRGTLLSSLGQPAEALRSVDRALELNAAGASNWAAKGVFLAQLQREEEALRALEEALRLDPKEHSAWSTKAAILHAKGAREEAVAAYARSLALEPQQPGEWMSKGLLEAELGRKPDAIQSFKEFLRRAPANDVQAIDRAKEELRKLESGGAKATPQQVQEWRERATILANQGRHAMAVEPLARALEAEPGDAKAWVEYARCLLELGRSEECLRAADNAIGHGERDPQGWLLKGQALNKLKRDEEAVAAYDQALQREPRLVRALLGKGQSLYLLGYRKQLGRAIESGGFSNGVLSMGELAPESRELMLRALEAFDQGLAVEPLNFNAKYLKGTTHLALGQKEEAARAYRQFLSAAPISVKATMDEVRSRLKEMGQL